MTLAVENQQEPTTADNPRNKELAYEMAIKISREVIRRAKRASYPQLREPGDKTCLEIFQDIVLGGNGVLTK